MSDTNYSKWYRTGGVTCTVNSKDVIGANTYWLNANIKPGDFFTLTGSKIYEIDTVDSNTHLTLKTPFLEATVTAAGYAIARNFTATLPAETASKVTDIVYEMRRYLNNDMASIQGKSAYDVACDNGFTGSESEWLQTLTAYGVAVENGFKGSASDWITALASVGDIPAFTQRADKIENNLTSTTNRTTTLEGNVSSVANRTSTNEADISGLKSRATALETSSSSQSTRLDALETSNASQSTSITNLESRAASIETLNASQSDNISDLLNRTWHLHNQNLIWSSGYGSNANGVHNAVFRGKDLGEPTAQHFANIRNGSFQDMFLGDYFTINSVPYTIIDFNYYKNSLYKENDTNYFRYRPHIVLSMGTQIEPDSDFNQDDWVLYYNETDDTSGGFVGSSIWTAENHIIRERAQLAKKHWESHFTPHYERVESAFKDGKVTAFSRIIADVMPFTCWQIEGCQQIANNVYKDYFDSIQTNYPSEYGRRQFHFFKFHHAYTYCQLRDISSATHVCCRWAENQFSIRKASETGASYNYFYFTVC